MLEGEQGWIFWEMLGRTKGKISGAWLCPPCAIAQEERRKRKRSA